LPQKKTCRVICAVMDKRSVCKWATGAVALLLAAPCLAVTTMQPQSAAEGAVQQSNRSSDITITRDIRRALVRNKSLSISAHNVTIVTQNGRVTLKGKVQSDAEKQTVESAATNVVGPSNVDDQLTTNH
jgi:hyperosmotically inducible periplasmic protein